MQKLPLNVIQYPSGRWGFVGRVPARLAYVNKDGTLLSDSQAIALSLASNPGLMAKTRAFESESEARAEAAKLGFTIKN